MKLCNIHIKNFIILSVSVFFKGFKNWQKVAETCYQLVHDRVSRGLALFWIWRHRLIYMALTLCEHACKTVCDVKFRIEPCPPPARSLDKEYQISGCTVAWKNFRCCEKNVKSLLEQLQVCIFAKIVFGVRCTLSTTPSSNVDGKPLAWEQLPLICCYHASSTFTKTDVGRVYSFEPYRNIRSPNRRIDITMFIQVKLDFNSFFIVFFLN